MENTYKIENGVIQFFFYYNIDIIQTIKTEIKGRSYNPDSKMWFALITSQNIDSIKSVIDKFKFQKQSESEDFPNVDINIQLEGETSLEQRKTILKQRIKALKLKETPREYQYEVIDYLIRAKKSIDGSECGTGKTFTSIFTTEVENLFPCLVITPLSVKYNWKKQWGKVNPKRKIEIIDDLKFKKADVYIVNYDRLIRKGFDKLLKTDWRCIICDESQALKNAKARRTKEVKEYIKKSHNAYLLSGTAVMNRAAELISPLNILGKFDILFGSWNNYVYTYCDAQKTRFGLDITGSSNTKELNSILKKVCYVRKEKREVLKDLPDLVETIIEVDITNEKEYRAAEKDLINYLKENFGKQKAEKAENAEHLVLLTTLRQLVVKGKLESIIEQIDSFLESCDRKLVVFGVYKETIDVLANIYKCDKITGDTKAQERLGIVERFQKSKTRILFGNSAMGTGVDGLQDVCSDMFIIDLPQRSTDLDQGVSRLERSGAKNKIEVRYILAPSTIDDDMWLMLEEKRRVTDGINKGKDYQGDSILRKLIQKYV